MDQITYQMFDLTGKKAICNRRRTGNGAQYGAGADRRRRYPSP